MKFRNSTPWICRLRKSGLIRFLTYLLTINFINLSANFFEGNIEITPRLSLEDPVDTVSELIFEIALDCQEDIIPDNGTHQDEHATKKIKLALIEIPGFSFLTSTIIKENPDFVNYRSTFSGHFHSVSPPPDPS
jgi:hypothetical protein